MLLRTGTLTPLSVPLYLRTFGRDWQFIENSGGRVLDQGFHRMGWDFFLRAGSIRGYAVGSGESSLPPGLSRSERRRAWATLPPPVLSRSKYENITMRLRT